MVVSSTAARYILDPLVEALKLLKTNSAYAFKLRTVFQKGW